MITGCPCAGEGYQTRPRPWRVSWFPIVDWVFAAVAITFGAVGISTAGRRGGAGKGMAVAGLVLGLVTAGLGLIFWAVIYGEFAGSQCAYGC
jgi:hypothetical protein